MWVVTWEWYRIGLISTFQSTPPVWVVTAKGTDLSFNSNLFQSTPPVWVVTGTDGRVALVVEEFQSTPPVWVVTGISVSMYIRIWFQSTPPVWVVTGITIVIVRKTYPISIHTTRVGGDIKFIISFFSCGDFNPHHPCGWWPLTHHIIFLAS